MIGKVLGGRYEIIKKVGGGGMAIVYKAKCNLLNRYVAVKVLRDEFVSDEEFIRKFRRESQAAASLSHPNIVGIYDVGVEIENDHNIHYIVMEYINGKTLKRLIQEKGKLSFQETINYSIQIAEALEHAHKNHIIHRDIKPHNIMVTQDGRIKVTDFGIARAATSSTLTNTSNVIGSVHYFSPEQARGGFTDEKSDIYSLGIVMYEMITGKIPFQGDSPISVALKHVQEEVVPPSKVDSSVPKNIENVICKCLRKNSSERYKNADELLKDLRKIKYSNGKEQILDDTSIYDSPTRIIPVVDDEKLNKQASSEKKKKPKKKKGNKNKKVVLLGILLAFLLATGLYAGLFKMKDIFFAQEVEVPDLVGLHEDVAKEEVKKIGLELEVKDRQFSSEFSEGQIISQNIDSGKKVKKGYPIEVIVSEGSKPIEVPDFTNKDINEIEEILGRIGLEIGSRDYRHSDDVPANRIISQSPGPYTEVSEGTAINFVISKGPEVKLVTVPNLVGQNINDAKNAIVASGLVLGDVSSKPSQDVPKDVVIWQSQKQGAKVKKNTSISIQISSGPSHTEEKEPDKEPNSNNVNKEVTVMFSFKLPKNKEETEVKIIRIQDGASEVVYNKVHNVNEEVVKVPIKGKPGAQLELYFDNVHQTMKKIPE